eukprot:TRINITY_DN4305_c0_g1_i1.p1 TRINITY_DN4305_c0_g1~~TRINITY_DN4305_c0_g1_i1.p1  ORF type:complete len:612 (+),score=214.28 TRINITY_DN4305_c0_g1_i1:63-1838(+)
MFSILAAADLFGTKLNYEICFNSQPSLQDLQRRVEHVFTQEGNVRRPPGDPTVFAIQRLQVFDEKVELWVDLLSATQITQMCQIYAFQPETQFHKEIQSKLPPATKAPAVSEPSLHRPAATVPASPYSALHSYSQPFTPTPAPAPAPAAAILPTSVLAIPADPSIGVTYEDKVRTVFDEIDSRKTGVALLTDFSALLNTLRIDVPPGISPASFFGKDLDTTVSYAEFQKFGEAYPTLLDAMVNRCREFWVGVKQNEGLEAAKGMLESLKTRDAEAKMMIVQSTAATNAHEMKVTNAATEVAQQEANERESEVRVQSARQECDRSAYEVSIRATEVQRAVEATRQSELSHQESLRGVEHTDALMKAQEMEILKSEEKYKELERLLREMQLEVESQRAAGQARLADLQAAQSIEQSKAVAKLEAERLAAMQDEQLAVAEAALVASQEREKESTAYNHASREATLKARAIKDAEDRELMVFREREAAAKVAEAESRKSLEGQEAVIRSLEQECQEHTAQILRVQHEEQPLIDQELNLRAQRQNLEAQEARLRSEHTNFQQRNGSRAFPTALPPTVSPTRELPQPYFPPTRPPLL